MSYRDPETGKVFENLSDKAWRMCTSVTCSFCCMGKLTDISCYDYVLKHPAEAARLMGYEVIEDSTTETDKSTTDTPTTLDDTSTDELVKEKPRLAEVLGVEVGEKFIIREGPVDYACIINQSGEPELSYWKISYAINHPESIIRIPHLTEAELEICKAVGAKWVSYKPHGSCFVMLTKGKPEWDDKYQDWMLNGKEINDPIARIRDTLFPSVKPGDCICVEVAEQ